MSIDGIAQVGESQFLRAAEAKLELPNILPNFVARLQNDGLILELKVTGSSEPPFTNDHFLGNNIADFLDSSNKEPVKKKIKEALASQQMVRLPGQPRNDSAGRKYDFLIIPSGEDQVIFVVTDNVGSDEKKEAFFKLNRTLLSLQSATSAVMLSLNIDQVLDTFSWELTNLLDVCGCAILEWDPRHDTLKTLAFQDKEGSFTDTINLGTRLAKCPSAKLVLLEKFAYQQSINHVGKTSPEYEFMRAYGFRTFAFFPLVFQDKTLGMVLAAKCQNETLFEDQSISAAQMLTNQAAAAMANARLHKQTEQQLKFHSILREAGQFFSSSLEQNTILNSIAEQLCVNLDSTSAYILSYNAQEQSSTVLAEYITPNANKQEQISDLGQTYKQDESDQTFIREGRSKVWHVDDANLAIEEKNHMVTFGAKSILTIPIIRSGKVVAFAQVWESRRRREFTEFEIELAEGIGQLAALALDNAKLYQRARHENSERKRAEKALATEKALLADRVSEQTAELRQANVELARAARSKDEFLASMSHELRTPLNAILGITEGMRDSFYGPLTEEQHNSLQLVEKSGLHLLELIDDILDLSRIESGQLSLDMTTVAVDDLCLGCIQLMRQTANKKHINISYSTDGQVHSIYADPRRLKQILINLLSNAVKFTPENGSVGLEVRTETENNQIHFTVWDTGIGISEEDRDRLFKPFSQLDSSLARRYGGTGLGLTLVKRMTELHKGSVSLDSEPDQGSRFTVSIPWKISGPLESGNSLASNEMKADKTIPAKNTQLIQSEIQNVLLVEDDKINAKIYLDCINSMNLPVTLAVNGPEAIELCQELKPGLILMDIQLPGMDGLTAIQHIRKMPEMKDTKIIALTALAMSGDRERCLKAGADMYLSKPVPLSTLKKVIKSRIEDSIPEMKSS